MTMMRKCKYESKALAVCPEYVPNPKSRVKSESPMRTQEWQDWQREWQEAILRTCKEVILFAAWSRTRAQSEVSK